MVHCNMYQGKKKANMRNEQEVVIKKSYFQLN